MKTLDTPPAEGLRRQRFNYDPDRHYVLAEKAHGDWEGGTLDSLLNKTDEHGNDLYTVEADGGDGPDKRRITGNKNLVLLSCPKAEFEAEIKAQAEESAVKSLKHAPDEEVKRPAAISLQDIPNSR